MKKQQKHTMSSEKQWLVVAGLVSILFLFAFVVFVADYFGAKRYTVDHSKVQVTKENVTIKGETACLPHRGDGPSTMECAIGIRDDDGYFYMVKNKNMNGSSTNTGVSITGTLAPSSGDEQYDIAGILTAK